MKHFKNERGNIMGALIGAAVAGIVMAALTTMTVRAQRDMRQLGQKLEIIQLGQFLVGAMANPAVCACNFDSNKNTTNGSSLRFNSNNPGNARIQMRTLYQACNAGGTAPTSPIARENQTIPGSTSGIRITNMVLMNITPMGPVGAFSGELFVNFDPVSTGIARQPVRVPMTFQIDTTSPPGSARIMGCASGPGGGSGGGNAPQGCRAISGSRCSTGQTAIGCFNIHYVPPGTTDATPGLGVSTGRSNGADCQILSGGGGGRNANHTVTFCCPP